MTHKHKDKNVMHYRKSFFNGAFSSGSFPIFNLLHKKAELTHASLTIHKFNSRCLNVRLVQALLVEQLFWPFWNEVCDYLWM